MLASRLLHPDFSSPSPPLGVRALRPTFPACAICCAVHTRVPCPRAGHLPRQERAAVGVVLFFCPSLASAHASKARHCLHPGSRRWLTAGKLDGCWVGCEPPSPSELAVHAKKLLLASPTGVSAAKTSPVSAFRVSPALATAAAATTICAGATSAKTHLASPNAAKVRSGC